MHMDFQDIDSIETTADQQYHDFNREPWPATDTEAMDLAELDALKGHNDD